MQLSRRQMLAGSALAAVAGTAGCLGDGIEPPGGNPRVTFSGNVDTGEPLVEDANVSTEGSYPYHYSKLVATEKAEAQDVRWEYIERELPQLVDDLEGTDFGSEFLVFFGMVLPATKQLQPGSTSIRDGTLHAEYRVGNDASGSSELVVNTAIKRVRADPPEDVAVSVRL